MGHRRIPYDTPAPRPQPPQTFSLGDLQTLSALVSRAQMAANLGYAFGGDRDVYQALGYDTTITWAKYASRYERQGFARAVIDRPVQATWGLGFNLVESSDDEETELERAWKDLEKRLGLISRFARLDRLTGLGSYGVLLLGLSDVKNKDDFRQPVRGANHTLNYVRPFSGMANDGDAQVKEWVTDPSDPRYGQPNIYSIKIQNLSTGDSHDLYVHHSRVIHVADGLGSSEVEGTPRLQPVWNNLMNLEKITGGSAEMYWRGARPGYQFNIEKDFKMTTAIRDTLQDVFDEYEHNLRRILELQGGKLEALTTQVSDPGPAVEVQLQEICAITGIPKRVLTGSERGELASSQDRENQADYTENRQLNFAEARVVRPTVDRFIELGILPPAKTKEGYGCDWPDQRTPSDLDKAKVGETRANAIAKYASQPMAEAVMPVQSFLRLCIGLSEDDIALVEEEKDAAMAEEGKEQKENPEPEPGAIPEEESQ